MAVYRGPRCKICRREGEKLFLKGTRCISDKCAFSRRSYSPGQHGKSRSKLSDYGVQLREKQKAKKIYGMLEAQFRLYFERASKKKGVTGHILLGMLEKRLDNVLFRLGLASSRQQARQMVYHGRVSVNDRKVDIPSYQVKVNDRVGVVCSEEQKKKMKELMETTKDRGVPGWLKLNEANFEGVVTKEPARDDIQFPIREQLIIELYSK